MDSFRKRFIHVPLAIAIFATLSHSLYADTGYFKLPNLMSAAQKTIPNNRIFNDFNLNLQNQEKTSGHVVNTQFSNDGGMAGCGVSSTIIQYMYKTAAQHDLSKNYIALNVFSEVMGFDPQAPFWKNPEGAVKGYTTFSNTIAYPYTPYHRIIPSLYPAYLGLFNNGLSCGRWIEADFDRQHCSDRTSPTGISKSCPDAKNLSFAGQKIYAYVFDSCEDNNGWCRDDAAHIDVNPQALTVPDNYYLQWKFVKNPYYTNPTAPASLKDIWLAWFSQASKYWSYVAILNIENGISNVQFNVGDINHPAWINSHVLAGDNNVTWESISNNGELWQVEPVNSAHAAQPSDNPIYQLRLFDYLGYPANHGAIYQFNLLFNDGTLGKEVSGFSFFYQGGSPVKEGTQPQNMTILAAPIGTGRITVDFNTLLPSNVSLNKNQANYLRPVLITDDGYSYDAAQCKNNKCVFANLPTAATYSVYAHAVEEISNDLTLRKVNEVTISSPAINFSKSFDLKSYVLKANDINLSTQYAARIQIPLKFSTTSTASLNANLQAFIMPDNVKNASNHITAQTQACFLSNYVNKITDSTQQPAEYLGNNSICTVYYTVNNQKAFTATAVSDAYFTVILPDKVGVGMVNFALAKPYQETAKITGYNPVGSKAPSVVKLPLATYQTGTSAARTLYLLLDPKSDAACLKNLNPTTGVSVTLGTNPTLNLITPDLPVQTELAAATADMTMQINMAFASETVQCQAMPSVIPMTTKPLQPGLDIIEVIKLVTIPKSAPSALVEHGILVTATGDNNCFGVTDTLNLTSNGKLAATANYTLMNTASKVGIDVAAGTYTISDKAFTVPRGRCQLTTNPSVSIKANAYTPVTLPYQFTENTDSVCNAKAQVTAAWPNGCTVQFSLTSPNPLSKVILTWQKGTYDWAHAKVWDGNGTITIPAETASNVTWQLPSWIDAQASTVGMNINNDAAPAICKSIATMPITCDGVGSN